ncbi:MAG: asparagine--tRNA ligase [Candidatus Marinimicrobia bacterium]|nr:asparagine--tRNA ligase [Candidatus Neomarinimicrobiota bacterium]|tara:strand:+ start:777 stop:2069 length:1293 start_codon:yes stop_codon:yes gene_type:complete
MENILVQNVGKHEGENVKLNGWVYNSRRSGKIGFLLFRDGTGIMQCIIVRNDVGDSVFDEFKKLTQETSISVQGEVVKNDRATGGFELLLSDFEIHHLIDGYPITPKDHGTEYLMNHRHLWIRSKRQHSILRIRHEIIKATRDFFDSNDFTLVDTPIFTSNACEGTTTLFETEYFGESAYLSQSGQLYGEANAMAFGRQYNFGPTFRAEKSKTRRHLTEFWMVEPEIAYCDLEGNIEWAEKLITFIINRVIENRKVELEVLERKVDDLKKFTGNFPHISYSEAVDMLQKGGFNFEWGGDFGSPEETYIAKQFEKPVVVHRFPTAIKAFYMKRDPENENVVLGMDILAPEGYGEIIGGAQREDNLDFLLERIKHEQLPQDEFEWYLDLRRYGSVPHAGFGMGIERVVAWICKLPHVRETIPYPRMIQTLRP